MKITVYGKPIAQPRVRAAKAGTHARVYDPGTADGWKAKVALAYREAGGELLPRDRGVFVDATFIYARPKSHYGTGRNADKIKTNAPIQHTGRPDIDNLLKAVMDALNGVAWHDDAQITTIEGHKRWDTEPMLVLGIY